MSTHSLSATRPVPPLRAEYERELAPLSHVQPARALPWHTRLRTHAGARQALILIALAALWEAAARWQHNDLLWPTFTATLRALAEGLGSGELLVKAAVSLRTLLEGYALGVLAAFAFTALATASRWGRDLLGTLTAMFNPLPAIALLPLALLWFGLGQASLLFVLVHAVLWPLALNTYAGFQGVPDSLRMTGRNYGLEGLAYVGQILVPAALPAILSGLKIGWAFAWRTLIAAELVFGASSGKGGLGWFIYESKNQLDIPSVFAGLFTVIIIGLLVENLIFRNIEAATIRKWGMQH